MVIYNSALLKLNETKEMCNEFKTVRWRKRQVNKEITTKKNAGYGMVAQTHTEGLGIVLQIEKYMEKYRIQK